MDLSKLKIVFFHSTEINIDHIIWGLLELGIDVKLSDYRVLLQEYKEEDAENVVKEIEGYDAVMTQDFGASVAEGAHRKGIPYISWVYDSPQRALYMKEARYDTSYIFSFDRKQVERIKATGANHVYYCPLAVNAAQISQISFTEEMAKKYAADVSFVGGLYQRDYVPEAMRYASPEIRQMYEDHLSRFAMKWNGESIFEKLNPELTNYFDSIVSHENFELYKVSSRFFYEYLMVAAPIAQIERQMVLKQLAKDHEVVLYTRKPDEITDLDNVIIRGEVGQISGAYQVYHYSKINLNLTMRGIETGVPQRVFEIMGSGGFAMSNYQPEAEYLFEPDKEIVLFRSLTELKDKVDYYLRHEDERQKIAAAGYKRVSEEYNYPMLLVYILNKVFG